MTSWQKSSLTWQLASYIIDAMKLKQLIKNRFYENHLQANKRVKDDFAVLDKYVTEMFPDQVTINNVVKSLSFDDKKYNFNYNVRFLPFHTNDTEWLATYMQKALSQLLSLKPNEKNNKPVLPFCSLAPRNFFYSPYYEAIPVSHRNVVKYIKYSPKFAEVLNDYEKNLTTAYITNFGYENGYDFYLSADKKRACLKSNQCDVLFRETVVDAMHSLGLKKDNVETSLETNAHLWRKPMMCRAFYNEKTLFTLDQFKLLEAGNPALYQDLMSKENRYLRTWIRLRENEYCKKHGKTMKRLGIATTSLELTPSQFAEVSAKNEELGAEYELTNLRALHSVEDLERNQGRML